MAVSVAGNTIRLDGPDLFAIREEFKQLPKNIAARVIGAGLKRAVEPAEAALKRIVPVGPTGNLRRAIKTLVKRYPADGAAAAMVGFVKAGTRKSKSAGGGRIKKGADRAFHQFFLEFGTRSRLITTPGDQPYFRSSGAANRQLRRALGARQAREMKDRSVKVRGQGGFIASSFNTMGPFKFSTAKQGFNKGRIKTSPQYPKAFFVKRNSPIHIPGVVPQYPIRAAFNASRAAIGSNLEREMRAALENGRKILEDQVRRRAAMRDLGKHL